MSTSPSLAARRSDPALAPKPSDVPSSSPHSEAQTSDTSHQLGLQDNTAAFSHNAAFPPSQTPQHTLNQQSGRVPDFTFRKPSASGLHLETATSAKSRALAEDHNVEPSHTILESEEKRPPTPSRQTELPRVYSRRSWGSYGSPSSTSSSPALGVLGDVTPLPSPLVADTQTEEWMRKAGRPHSNSNASIERGKTAGLLSPVVGSSSPQRKKKAYGNLAGSPPAPSSDQNGTPDRIRAHSEYVPDHLQNARPRVVTGPSVPAPPPSQIESNQHEASLHRERFLPKQRPSVDQGVPLDPTHSLPSPPPSTHEISEEGEDSEKSLFLTVRDFVSHQTTAWKTLRTLGNGAFSEVFLASRDTKTGSIDSGIAGVGPESRSLVAIKVVSHQTNQDEERVDTSIKREIEILGSMSHPCLPKLYAFEDTQDRALLVLNYCPGGDLFEVASQQRELLTTHLIQRIFAELVAAVSCLHQNFIAHRDIKLENVLLNYPLASLPPNPQSYAKPIVTLTDLGLAKHIPPPPASPLLTHPCGSVDYAAPEVLLGQPYDGRATDGWALGVLLYSLMEGRLPFDPIPNSRKRGANNVKHRIARCDWLWCECGDEDGGWDSTTVKGREMQGAKEVVEGLLRKTGRGRWSVDKVAHSDWVRSGIRCEGGLSGLEH